MSLRNERTYLLSKVMIVSQLRAGRSDNSRTKPWERPLFVLAIDAIAMTASSSIVLYVISVLPAELISFVALLAQQALAFLPMLVLAMVLLAGVMFELNSSSRFASSELVNWLPIAKSEYVAASALSVSYVYSPYLCIAVGVVFALSIQAHLLFAWLVSLTLSLGSLLTGGFLIEILRASINRVYSAMSKRTGRATLVVRIVLAVSVLVAFQAAFYPDLLFNVMTSFVGALDASFFVPIVWSSLAVLATIAGDVGRSAMYGGLASGFVVLMFVVAVLVRSKYWSPSQAAVSFTSNHRYSPHRSRLEVVGLSDMHAAIIIKDLRGYVRQKELLAFLTMPFLFTALLVIQGFSLSLNESSGEMTWLVAYFVAFSSSFLSSSCIGTEGKSMLHLYAMPVDAETLIRAKMTASLVISLAGALAMSVVSTAFFGRTWWFFTTVFVVSSAIATQSVLIGLVFATRHSQFAERPKPRYISMSGMLKALVVTMGAALTTLGPFLLPLGLQSPVPELLSFISFACSAALGYKYSVKGAQRLMTSMPD